MLSKSSTDTFVKIFKELNLDKEHARIYAACLENGPSPASKLAKIAQVPRSTAYYLLRDLAKRGLISEIQGDTKLIFSPASPQKLQELLTEEHETLWENLKQLKTNQHLLQRVFLSHQAQFPKVSFYEGEKGLKTVLYDSLSADEILVTCQGEDKTKKTVEDQPKYLFDFLKEVVRRNIRTRELVQDNPNNRDYWKQFSSKRNKILLIPTQKKMQFNHVDKHIYGSKIAYISHDNLVGVIIEDETLAANERAQFEVLWKYYKGK